MNRQTMSHGSLPKNARAAGASSNGDAARQKELAKVVADVVSRRAQGENLPDSVVLAQWPNMRPELQDELAALRDIHRTFLAAQKAGPISMLARHDSDPLAARLPGHPRPDPQRLPSEPIHGYTVIAEASSGGQGAVFRARHEITGKTVAIKVIWGGALTGSRHRARFEREAQIMAGLDHPHIVPILDRGRTADGSMFLVMPFIEGCPLDEHMDGLRSEPEPDVKRALELFVLICRAVAEAHQKGIIHRDLKPTNVLVDRRGEPHILDFGLARIGEDSEIAAARSVTMAGQIVGSLPWASPEQVSPGEHPMDVRSDVYSLGVMLYQALCGVFPYSIAGSIQEVLNNILTVEPAPPGQVRGPFARQIRSGLDAIVLRALAKAPDRRYASAAELGDDLENYLAGRTLDRATLPSRARLWRNWAGAAFVAVVTIAIAGVIAWQQCPPDSRQDLTLPRISNSIGMRLASVPPGSFMMGSPATEAGHDSNEPLHRVTIDHPFLIGVTEVTQREYRLVMGSLPPGQLVQGDNIPVHGVTLENALAFCRELSNREHVTYRLPTGEEWEYACRASANSRAYAWPGTLDTMGWYRGNSNQLPHPVASLTPNIWGLYDMHGGVNEWCRDLSKPFQTSGVSVSTAEGEVDFYNLRGGSFMSPAQQCRSASRSAGQPENRFEDAGLRMVCDETR